MKLIGDIQVVITTGDLNHPHDVLVHGYFQISKSLPSLKGLPPAMMKRQADDIATLKKFGQSRAGPCTPKDRRRMTR